MLNFRSFCPFSWGTPINNINIKKIENVHDLMTRLNILTDTKKRFT